MGLIKGGVKSQESIVFEHSPEATYWDIASDLEEFEECEIISGMKLPSLFWVSGMLAPLGQEHRRNDELLDDVWVFSISKNGIYIRLLTEDAFFRFNIHSLLKHPTTLGDNFRPNVRALLKGFQQKGDDSYLLATPLVIIEHAEY